MDVSEKQLSEASTPTERTDKTFSNATKLSWPRKIHIVIAGFTCTFNGNLGSSIPSGALVSLSEHFGVTSRTYLVLLNSLYMAGYVLGPLLFGPMSEYIGRRPVIIGTFLGYLVFMLACSGAPTFAALLVFRLCCGICASAPTAVIGGLYADIFDNPSHRGTAMSLYMTVTTIGPLVGPIISGFASQISWRWPFWVAVMIAAPGLPLVLTLPETFAPVLHNKAMKKYEKQGISVGGEESSQTHVLNPRKIFLRPAKLMVTEPVLLCSALYMALAYSLMFLSFQAYPIIFQVHYGLSSSMTGLAFIPTIIGTLIAFVIGTVYTKWHDKASAEGKEWTKNEAYRRLPLACIASPSLIISLFWLGWTAWPESVGPIVPMISGLFFGIGFQLIFISIINYVTDIYRDLSASAHSAASMTRSIGAVLLPLAAGPMYNELGIHWAPSLLGFIALFMGVIPFVFIKYGDRMIKKSQKNRDVV